MIAAYEMFSGDTLVLNEIRAYVVPCYKFLFLQHCNNNELFSVVFSTVARQNRPRYLKCLARLHFCKTIASEVAPLIQSFYNCYDIA